MNQPLDIKQAVVSGARREDVLVSLAFTDLEPSATCFKDLTTAAQQVAKIYRYWEVLIVVDAAMAADFQPLMRSIENIRMIKVRAGVQT